MCVCVCVCVCVFFFFFVFFFFAPLQVQLCANADLDLVSILQGVMPFLDEKQPAAFQVWQGGRKRKGKGEKKKDAKEGTTRVV